MVQGVAVDPAAGVAYATSPGATWVIDASSNTITDTLTRGGASVAVAATPGSAYERRCSGYGFWRLTPSAANAMSPVINSQTDAIFSTGTAGSATIQASALPAATFSESGVLPTGLTFNSDGTISGTPAAGTGGFYPVTITASNGVAPDFSQSFGVAVDQPIVITSANHATFRVGDVSSFTFASTGYPTPYYQVSGTLPAGVTLLWSQASGWQLTGSANAGSGGVYPLTIHALDGNGGDVTQAFTLTVLEAPSFTSQATAVFRAGHSGAFTCQRARLPGSVLHGDRHRSVLGQTRRRRSPSGRPASARWWRLSLHDLGPERDRKRGHAGVHRGRRPAAGHHLRAARHVPRRIGPRSGSGARASPPPSCPSAGTCRAGCDSCAERNGTAILTGKLARGARGRTYKITITAANGVGPAVHQTFWLKVS